MSQPARGERSESDVQPENKLVIVVIPEVSQFARGDRSLREAQ